MRTIQQIYDEREVPPNLQRHMLRVAAAAEFIADNWRGAYLDKEKMLRVLLLHDIGNIVKSDFDNQPQILEEEACNVDYWKSVQQRYIDRFGTDDHAASHAIGAEVGLSSDELQLLDAKIFVKNDATVLSEDFQLKISAYVDQRVGPFGLLPLLERLLEARERYRDKPGSSMNNPKTEFLIECALKIEQQIMEFSTITPDQIDDEHIAPRIDRLRGFRYH